MFYKSETYSQATILCSKTMTSVKCSRKGCNIVFAIGFMCLKVLGWLTSPHIKSQKVKQVFCFCPKGICFQQAPPWWNVEYLTELFVNGSMSEWCELFIPFNHPNSKSKRFLKKY